MCTCVGKLQATRASISTVWAADAHVELLERTQQLRRAAGNLLDWAHHARSLRQARPKPLLAAGFWVHDLEAHYLAASPCPHLREEIDAWVGRPSLVGDEYDLHVGRHGLPLAVHGNYLGACTAEAR